MMYDWLTWIRQQGASDLLQQYQIDLDEKGFFWHYEGHIQRLNWMHQYHDLIEDGAFKKYALIRAIKGRTGADRYILDCCAGLGKDAMLMAVSGCQVLTCERSPILFALLKDHLDRYQLNHMMHCVYADAISLMENWPISRLKPDVIYLDPMFNIVPRAKVKQHSWLLQSIGMRTDNEQLFNRALSLAGDKVVVKRSRRNDHLVSMKPTYTIEGKTTRYDVYQR